MASEIKVDTISEKTSANGITIDGVNIKDSAIATAGSVPLTAIDIDGGTDIGAAIVDADLFIIDDGAGGTNRKTTASRLKTYVGGSDPSSADGDSLGTASLEWSDLYLADGGIVYFGNDQDIRLTHNADKGLIIKHSATADDKPVILTLQTGETDMAANDVMGKIEFQAPDEGTGTDAVLVSAAIQAVAEGDFSSSSNATRLEFMTGSSEAATAKMSLSSAALLTLTDASPKLKILPTTNGNDGVLEICGRSTDGSPTENRTQIKGEAEGSTANTRMSFHVENASGVNERMRIDSSGQLFLGVTSSSGFNGSTFKVSDGFSIYRDTSTGGNGILLFYSDANSTAGNVGYYTANGGLANYQSNNVNLSDERLKKDIVDCPSTWDKIKSLKVRNFKYKQDGEERVVTGLIAQETETVDSNLVNSENGLYGYEEEQKDGKFKQIYTTDLYHQMLKALQEAQTKIETLETKVKALEDA